MCLFTRFGLSESSIVSASDEPLTIPSLKNWEMEVNFKHIPYSDWECIPEVPLFGVHLNVGLNGREFLFRGRQLKMHKSRSGKPMDVE